MNLNKELFFNHIRGPLFKGSLSASQVSGIESFLNYNSEIQRDVRKLAYTLATVYHESNKTFQPIEEIGRGKGHTYGSKIKYSGAKYTSPDKIYFGRGHIQVTWYEIYEKLTKIARARGKNWDFLGSPELMLFEEPSLWATHVGMIEGIYTGRKLSDYFNDTITDPLFARSIINGRKRIKTPEGKTIFEAYPDKAELIRDYYSIFLTALINGNI